MFVYQGGKRLLAKGIIYKIFEKCSHKSVFFDLFGGGGAISDTATGFKVSGLFDNFEYKKVYYNELHYIYFAYKWLNEHGTSPLGLFEFIDKQEFYQAREVFFGTEEEIKAIPEAERARAAFIRSIWSFGGGGATYVKGDGSVRIAKLFSTFGMYLSRQSTLNEVVTAAKGMKLKDSNGKYFDVDFIVPDIVEWSDKLIVPLFKSCFSIQGTRSNDKLLQSLSELRIETYSRLKGTKPAPNPSKLHFYNANALDILERPEDYCDEPNNTVFYADPPYWNTANYRQTAPFDYDRFVRAAKAFKYPLFVSEYNNLLGFKEIWKQRKRVTISQFDNSKTTIERLLWNGL